MPGTTIAPQVHFPLMTPDEVAAVTLSATSLFSSEGASDPPQSSPCHSEVVTPARKDAACRLRDILQTHGCAVITDIVDKDEVASLEAAWRSDLVGLVDKEAALQTAEGREALALLSNKAGRGPGSFAAFHTADSAAIGSMPHRGFATMRGTPHGRMAWQARLHPHIKQAFAMALDTPVDTLATGMDNTFWSPPQVPTAETNGEWLHVDQNTNTGLTTQCYQGILYLWSSETEHASTTVVWPGSHRSHIYDNIIAADPHAKELGKQWCDQLIRLQNLTSDSGVALHKQAVAHAKRIPVPAGALLLWDSRLTHQGWVGGPRLAQPVCWEPVSRRSTDAWRRKLWMCAAGISSTHASTEGRVHPNAPKGPLPMFEGGMMMEDDKDGVSNIKSKDDKATLDDNGVLLSAGTSNRNANDPTPSPSPSRYALPLLPTLIPYGVRPDAFDTWDRMMKTTLWNGADGHESAMHSDTDAIQQLLREEVIAAL
eukprot:m.53984 g.53984  ORF g.53984 m.53984 type:complete len:484 (+) comp7498_c0_seq2:99-1550(+)